MERITDFDAAWDERNPEPSKNYGIHGVGIRMVLKGTLGAVQFVIYTNWHLPHVSAELWAKHKSTHHFMWQPSGADVGYHSPTPQYEGQDICQEECQYLDGKPCYYDGSGLAAETMLALLIAEGGEAVWAKLEERYVSIFGELK